METLTKPVHSFEKAGLGTAPFRFLGTRENWYSAAPEHKQPGGSCDYCYTGIAYEYWVESSDGKRFKVGCDCILRLDEDPELKAAAKAEQLRLARQSRGTKKAAERKAAAEKWQSEREARNAQREAEKAERRAAYEAANAEFIGKLNANAHRNEFLTSMVANLESFGRLTEAQQATAERILTSVIAEQTSEHVGTKGQRITLTLTTERVVDITFRKGDGYAPYGFKGIHICRDENGNRIVYTGRSEAIPYKGCTSVVTATVKDHSEYNGVKQTEIKAPRLDREIKTLDQACEEEHAAELAAQEQPAADPEPAAEPEASAQESAPQIEQEQPEPEPQPVAFKLAEFARETAAAIYKAGQQQALFAW